MKQMIIVAVLSSFIVASSYLAEAQQATKTVPRIGFISSSGAPATSSRLFEALQQGLLDLGYVDGKNIVIVHRYAEGRLDRMAAFVNEFVHDKVDLIVAPNNVAIAAAKAATKTIPIIMLSSVDPVAAGYVQSFAHPGGNITGFAWMSRDLSAKRVELLKEVLPRISRLGVLWDADGPGPAVAFKEYKAAAQAFKLDLRSLEVRGPTPDLPRAFKLAKTARVDALIVVGNPLIAHHAKEVFELAAKNRLPSMTEDSQYVNAGGLISYGPNRLDLYRRVSGYAEKIIKGTKPGELPVQSPSSFELVINGRTANSLSLAIPRSVRTLADEVID